MCDNTISLRKYSIDLTLNKNVLFYYHSHCKLDKTTINPIFGSIDGLPSLTISNDS